MNLQIIYKEISRVKNCLDHYLGSKEINKNIY